MIATLALCLAPCEAPGAFLDAQGNVYLVSSPTTFTAPTTANAFQPVVQQSVCLSYQVPGIPGGNAPIYCAHGYIQKISPDGKRLLAATYLGGNSQDSISSIATDSAGDIYVTGQTTSTDFPVTPDAFQTKPGGAFLTVLSPDCSKLLYSTYLGLGNPIQILIDASGRVILAGLTQPPNFPATAPVVSNKRSDATRFLCRSIQSSTPKSAHSTTVTPFHTFPVTSGAYSHMAGTQCLCGET